MCSVVNASIENESSGEDLLSDKDSNNDTDKHAPSEEDNLMAEEGFIGHGKQLS